MNTPSIVSAERSLLRLTACIAADTIISANDTEALRAPLDSVRAVRQASARGGAAATAPASAASDGSAVTDAAFTSSDTISPSRTVITRFA